MFWNVYYLGKMGLKPDVSITDTSQQELSSSPDALKTSIARPQSVAVSRKRKFRGTLPARHHFASVSSSVADVRSKTTDRKVPASSQPTAAVDVVASMHSYAMPSYIHRPIKLAARHSAVESVSCADDKTANHTESSALETVKQEVSFHCLSV